MCIFFPARDDGQTERAGRPEGAGLARAELEIQISSSGLAEPSSRSHPALDHVIAPCDTI